MKPVISSFDAYGVFEVRDVGLLQAIAGGGPKASVNGTCGARVNDICAFIDGECADQTNATCTGANGVCGSNTDCGILGLYQDGMINASC